MIHEKRVLGTVAYLGGLPALLERFAWAWGQIIQCNTEYLCHPGEIVHYDRAAVSLHDFARNTLVDRMQGDWLLQLDTDHEPDPDLCVRLVRAMLRHDVDVVTAIYRHKTGIGSPVLYQWDASGRFAMPIASWGSEASVIQVGSAGAGALLVRRRVFQRMREELHQSPFERFDNYGEDHAFFQRCRVLEIPVYALMTVESPHLVVSKSRLADYTPTPGVPVTQEEVQGFR